MLISQHLAFVSSFRMETNIFIYKYYHCRRLFWSQYKCTKSKIRSFVVSVNNYSSRYIKVNDKTIYCISMNKYSRIPKIFNVLICLRYIQNLTDICCHMKFKRLPHSDIYLEIIGSVVVLDVLFLYCSNHFVCVPSIEPHST